MGENRRLTYGLVLLVLTLWCATFLLMNWGDQARGTFGDMFGAVNALFSGLAFVGIIISMRMQRLDLRNQGEELRLQRQELALQRKELEETREVFEKQSNIMADQQNDSTFFNLLSNHRLTVQSIKTSGSVPEYWENNYYARSNEITTGYEVVESVANAWIDLFTEYSKMYRSGIIWDLDYANQNPVEVVLKNENMGVLVQEVMNIWKFIDKRFQEEERQFYEETLVRSLLDPEKFIVQTWFTAQNLEEAAPFGRSQYESHNFIDFTREALPEIGIEFRNEHRRPYSEDFKFITVQTEAELLNFYTVVKPPEYVEGKLEIQKVNIEIPTSSIELTVLDFFRNTSFGFSQFPLSGTLTQDIPIWYYFVLFEVKHLNRRYFIPLKLSFERREEKHGSDQFHILSKNSNKDQRWMANEIESLSKIIVNLGEPQQSD